VARPPSAEGEGADLGAYVPDAITFCVVRIQRAWRMYAALHMNRRMRAVLALQKCWRGHVCRRNLKETLKAQAKGRQVSHQRGATHTTQRERERERESECVCWGATNDPRWGSIG
jgi:hypothetical protein